MSSMTKDEINVSLFDECQSRAIRIDKLERELQEAVEIVEHLQSWIKDDLNSDIPPEYKKWLERNRESEAGE